MSKKPRGWYILYPNGDFLYRKGDIGEWVENRLASGELKFAFALMGRPDKSWTVRNLAKAAAFGARWCKISSLLHSYGIDDNWFVEDFIFRKHYIVEKNDGKWHVGTGAHTGVHADSAFDAYVDYFKKVWADD